MKKSMLLAEGLIVLLLLSAPATAMLAPSSQLTGTIDKDTSAFFLGATQIVGNITGFPMTQLIDSTLVQDMNAFPLIGATSITNLHTVIVLENIDIMNFTSIDELDRQYHDRILYFSDVDIITEEGLFLLGINQGYVTVSSNLDYAITSFYHLEITPGLTNKFHFTAASAPLNMQCFGSMAVFTALSDDNTIIIKDKNGATHWSGDSSNTYLIIQDESFSVTQQPPMFLFPYTAETSESLKIEISTAQQNDINVLQLIDSVFLKTQKLYDFTTPSFLQQIDLFEVVITTNPLVANGAMVLFEANDTIIIDKTSQRFSTLGFCRFSHLTLTSTNYSFWPTVQADCMLIFLGDHFYNPQAKHSPQGISFPFELLIIWILAISLFALVHFYIKPELNEEKDNALRRYSWIMHIILFIIAILLLDWAIYNLFGISAFLTLFTQGFSIISAALLLALLIIWSLGYILLGFPLRIIIVSVMRILGINKGGKGIAKGIGNLSIGFFGAIYIPLIMNILINLFHLNDLFI